MRRIINAHNAGALAAAILCTAGRGYALPAPAGTWRLFNDESPWNTTIEGAPLQTAGSLRGFTTHDSAAYVQFLDGKATYSTVSTSKWSLPIYFVDGTVTPGVTVLFTGEEDYVSITQFLDAMNPVPIPSFAVSDPGESGHYPPLMSDIIPDRDITDAEICIIDLASGEEYDFWHMAKDTDGNWRASAGGKVSIYGDGVVSPEDLRTYSFARGTAVPIAAGIILRNEVAAGEIRHALAMSIPDAANQKDFYVWPGLITDGRTADSRALPEGARLRLKWSEEEIEARYQAGRITATGRIIALALRRYGAFNIDNGGEGHLNFYAQNFSDTSGSHNADTKNWGGLLNMDGEGYADDIGIIRPSDFEVIQFEYGRDGSDGLTASVSANGSTGDVSVGEGELLTVAASLDPGGYTGREADWWMAAATPFGFYWFAPGSGWARSDEPLAAYRDSLFSLPPYEVLRTTTLPTGAYTFYFGVDLSPNDSLDLGMAFYDSIVVTVQPRE